uniref:Peptidoglycan/LPS O-acetylase OafA/YrhL, contains acyltransferase and SGNH-hydrolase domains n=1 Tax=Candidatus Kentrum sp. DK TaxID=2126562 RepID=A0A450T6Y1_9GAMM|nr:MAG: Peptidoglycan/LPS O-acetylase OafA/YrhL, contains acyltransferase and SGNH-hydrolase domains [Candidatus Kentron sp. DK]
MEYRREIDGLRAIAVLPVILFHAGFNAFEGGFVGVDVFFVVSGYLITTIIISDMNEGGFSITTFYERRARRILPALFFIMFCCLPFAWLWLAPNHLENFFQSLASVSLFSSNIFFWKESGYFSAAAELKPLLHTWSLAVEEQYYMIFPLFLMVLWKLRKRFILFLLLMIAAMSLAAAQYGAYYYPLATFFLLHTRGWELAIGAIIAFYLFYKEKKVGLANSFMWINEGSGFIGLGLILYSVLIFDKITPFPGFFALIPTVGAALIIVFSTERTIVGRFLGTRVLAGVGLISYSAYLWHQPLFAFARHRNFSEPSLGLLLILSVSSLVLAYVTWRFVEVPFRNRSIFSRRKIFIMSIGGSVSFMMLGAVGDLKDGFPERVGFPDELVASFKRATPTGECFDKKGIHEVDGWYCRLGKNKAEPSFMVFGDSHAISFFDVFDTASHNLGLAGAFTGSSGCTPFLGIHALRKDQKEKNCHQLNKRVFDYVVDNGIDAIFLIARWTYYTEGSYTGKEFSYIGLKEESGASKEGSRQAFLYGFSNTIRKYKEHDVDVFVISQVPQQKIEPVGAYQRAYMFHDDGFRKDILMDASVSLGQHKKLNNYTSSIFARNQDAIIINFDDLLCDTLTQRCPIGTIRTSYYFDDDHLSLPGAKRLLHSVKRLLDVDSLHP